jgi:hypothetical protein
MNRRKLKNEPDKHTIPDALVGVREWECHGKYTHIPYNISSKFSNSKLHGALVYVIGPGDSYISKTKVVNRVIKINNKTLMIRIIRLEHKSKKYVVGDTLEIKPSFLKAVF